MKNSTISRRGFLATALAASAGPLIIPSRALGRDGAVAPSERITMGFIGLGGQGSGHLFGGSWTYVAGGYLGRKEVQVLGVCDVWPQKRESARDRVNNHYAQLAGAGSFKSCEAYLDFREMIARPDIDAVLMALPFHLHAPVAMMAAKNGKDVYSEKPIALTIEEGRLLADTMKRYRRVYQAGTQQRSEAEYGGKFRRACELVRNGYIGQLKEIYAFSPGGGFSANMQNTSGPGIPEPEGFSWDLYVGPGPWRPYTGGNANCGLFSYGDPNWGPHHYDAVQWVIEKEHPGPVEVGYEDEHAVLRYENGLVIHGCKYPGEEVGAVGGACFIGTDGYIAVDRENIVSNPPEILKAQLKPEDERPYLSPIHAGNFLECIRTRKLTICNAETAHRSMSLVLLAGIATQLRRKMTWDPVKEVFVDDEQANRLLSYARRPGWEV